MKSQLPKFKLDEATRRIAALEKQLEDLKKLNAHLKEQLDAFEKKSQQMMASG